MPDPYGGGHADIYDELYAARGKDYRAEAASIAGLIVARRPDAVSLLDVGCGTGGHLVHLRARFPDVAGADPSPDMRARAVARLPGVPLFDAGACEIATGRAYDAVICMFAAIGYVGGRTGEVVALDRAVAAMAAHLTPGGVLVVEPWLTPDAYVVGHVGSDYARTKERTMFRLSHSGLDPAYPRVSVLTMDYLVGSANGIRHFTDTHLMSMFTTAELFAAFESAGCTSSFVDPGFGRGVVVGVRG